MNSALGEWKKIKENPIPDHWEVFRIGQPHKSECCETGVFNVFQCRYRR
jgi:hypothetical protein